MNAFRKTFDVYDTLTSRKKLTDAERKTLQKLTDALTVEKRKAVLLLIAEYALRHDWDGNGIPLLGKQTGDDVIFNSLPDDLESMIFTFIRS